MFQGVICGLILCLAFSGCASRHDFERERAEEDRRLQEMIPPGTPRDQVLKRFDSVQHYETVSGQIWIDRVRADTGQAPTAADYYWEPYGMFGLTHIYIFYDDGARVLRAYIRHGD